MAPPAIVDGGAPPEAAASNISVNAVLSGACYLSELDVDASACMGYSAFGDCGMAKCNLSSCMSACSDYAKCLAGTSDACGPTCMPSSACSDCQRTVFQCTTNMCLGTLSCGPTAPGGSCDKLDMCCAGQPAMYQTSCRYAATVARLEGDTHCQQLIDLPPMPALFYPCNDGGLLEGGSLDGGSVDDGGSHDQ